MSRAPHTGVRGGADAAVGLRWAQAQSEKFREAERQCLRRLDQPAGQLDLLQTLSRDPAEHRRQSPPTVPPPPGTRSNAKLLGSPRRSIALDLTSGHNAKFMYAYERKQFCAAFPCSTGQTTGAEEAELPADDWRARRWSDWPGTGRGTHTDPRICEPQRHSPAAPAARDRR